MPPYQRGFVWQTKQEAEFIDTLKRGLPSGTILLYRDDVENKYQIIDGLQRCTTIYKFISEPAQFFNEGDIEENVPQQLAKITNLANASAIINDIMNHLVVWVHGVFQTMEEVRDMEAGDYAFAFTSVYPSAKGREQEISKIVKPTLKKFKNLCEGLYSVRIATLNKGTQAII